MVTIAGTATQSSDEDSQHEIGDWIMIEMKSPSVVEGSQVLCELFTYHSDVVEARRCISCTRDRGRMDLNRHPTGSTRRLTSIAASKNDTWSSGNF